MTRSPPAPSNCEAATEQERLAIEAFYHLSVTGDLERSIETNTRWTATYPND